VLVSLGAVISCEHHGDGHRGVMATHVRFWLPWPWSFAEFVAMLCPCIVDEVTKILDCVGCEVCDMEGKKEEAIEVWKSQIVVGSCASLSSGYGSRSRLAVSNHVYHTFYLSMVQHQAFRVHGMARGPFQTTPYESNCTSSS